MPRVANLGLAKLMGRDFSHVLTTMQGTVGYLAPKWIASTTVTAKADMFSYGMILFEIVSGRRNVGQHADGTVDFLPSTAVSLLLNGDVRSAVDSQLGGSVDVAQVERACKVVCWCMQEDESLPPIIYAEMRLPLYIYQLYRPSMYVHCA